MSTVMQSPGSASGQVVGVDRSRRRRAGTRRHRDGSDDGCREPATSCHEKSFHACTNGEHLHVRVGSGFGSGDGGIPFALRSRADALEVVDETARQRRSLGDGHHHVGTDHRVSVLGCERRNAGIGQLGDGADGDVERARTCLDRGDRGAAGQRGRRDGAAPAASPTREARIVDLDRTARRSSPTPRRRPRAVRSRCRSGRTPDGQSPTTRRLRCPPTSSPAASPTQVQSSGSPTGRGQAPQRGRRARRARSATRQLPSARSQGVGARPTSRRSSTISGNGAIVIQIGASDGSSSAASASSVVAASSIRMSRSSCLGERVAGLAQVLHAHDLAVRPRWIVVAGTAAVVVDHSIADQPGSTDQDHGEGDRPEAFGDHALRVSSTANRIASISMTRSSTSLA